MPRARAAAAGPERRRPSAGAAGRRAGPLSTRLSRGSGQTLPGPAERAKPTPGRGFGGPRGAEEGKRVPRRSRAPQGGLRKCPRVVSKVEN